MAFKEAKASNWGDDSDDENDEIVDVGEQIQYPSRFETGPDANGVRTITVYREKEDGTKIKHVRRVRVVEREVRVNKNVEARRHWVKFADCEGCPPGHEPAVNCTGKDEVDIEFPKFEKKQEEEDTNEDFFAAFGRLQRLKQAALRGEDAESEELVKDRLREETDRAAGGGAGKYVPPSRRGGGERMPDRDEQPTIRVTNLPEDIEEGDLREMFRNYGPLHRIYLRREKGFAFVNFIHKADAQRALNEMKGCGFGHLILHLEWARPSKPRT
eukprot:TRINITY_DN778_c0_g1_i1.p1 TRINITY_DN778_c0_g1~~TRINITY_DN778_c0_g1_i1.p1  ORF type:complete len:304 (-),score=77.86 TRINITY_DN778_c0_g1_i1:186-998(-)